MTGQEQHEGDSRRQDRYMFRYDSAVTQEYHNSRTAESNAAFFLPYLKSGMSLLDCGCGSGSITLGLAELVAPGEVVGIDVSDTQIAAAQELARERGISNARFETASVYELPFPDETFDAVFSHNMPEHLEEPVDAFKEMYRVLKRGGLVGVRDVDGSGYLLPGPSEYLVRQSIDDVWIRDWIQVSGDPYIGKKLRSLLREAGFINMEAFASYDVYPTPEALKWVTDVVASRFEEPEFIERAIENRLATREMMERYVAAWRELGSHPDSMFANAHGEAVGWKE